MVLVEVVEGRRESERVGFLLALLLLLLLLLLLEQHTEKLDGMTTSLGGPVARVGLSAHHPPLPLRFMLISRP